MTQNINKTIMDFTSLRNQVDQANAYEYEYDYIYTVAHLDDKRTAQDKTCTHMQNAAKTLRWYEAWRDCPFSDETVVGLIRANNLLEEKIAEMYDAARRLAKWEKKRLDKVGKPYAEYIIATLRPGEIDIPEDILDYLNLFKHNTDAVSRCSFILRDGQSLEEKPMSHHYAITDIPDEEICQAAVLYDNFLRASRREQIVAVPIDSGLKTILGLPANIGKKWQQFFMRLDKFNGLFFILPLLAMIGRFKLTPEDVCAIVDYSYAINIDHYGDAIVPNLFMW